MVAQVDKATLRIAPATALQRVVSRLLFEGHSATAGHQYLNRITGTNLALAAAGRLPTRPIERPIFILGIGRSGTTLLGKLLGVTPGLAYCNEGKAIWAQAIRDEDVQGWFQETGRYRLEPDSVSAEETLRLHRQYGWFLAMLRAERIIEKYPECTYRVPYIRSAFPDARVAAIVRHPGDVAVSIARYEEANGSDEATWWGRGDAKWTVMCTEFAAVADPVVLAHMVPEADPQTRGLVEWVLGMETLRRSELDAWISYDRLCAGPTAIAALCDRLEITDPSRPLAYHREIVAPTPVAYDHSIDGPLMTHAQALYDELAARSL